MFTSGVSWASVLCEMRKVAYLTVLLWLCLKMPTEIAPSRFRDLNAVKSHIIRKLNTVLMIVSNNNKLSSVLSWVALMYEKKSANAR